MNWRRSTWAAMLLSAAVALLPLAACGDNSSPAKPGSVLLPRGAIVSMSVVTQYFPDITRETSTGPNQTLIGKPIASRAVVFTSADGKKKITLSVDQYADVGDAAAAYEMAVQGSKAAPGFEPATPPDLGQEAFAGTSKLGTETHFGLGTRDGRLIVSATHAGDIAVTPANSNKLAGLAAAQLVVAGQALGSPDGDDERVGR